MRTRISVIGWTRRGDRLRDLAEAIGGEARVIFTPRLAASRQLVPLRYLTCALIMVGYLLRRRPTVVIVVNPPLWPAFIALAYCRINGARLILDSHPGGFGAQGHGLERRFQVLHRFLVRRAAGVLVTTDDWVEVVEAWGGTGRIVHEPPRPKATAAPREDPNRRPVVLFVCIFAPDEPVDAVIQAARQVPGCDWWITGDPAKAAPGSLDDLPANARLTGYLGPREYEEALDEADIVLALTTEPTSIMRAAYEAVYAMRPLVVSDFPAIAATFPYARRTSNDGSGIARTVEALVDALPAVVATTPDAYRAQVELWNHQLTDLCELVRGGHPKSRGTATAACRDGSSRRGEGR